MAKIGEFEYEISSFTTDKREIIEKLANCRNKKAKSLLADVDSLTILKFNDIFPEGLHDAAKESASYALDSYHSGFEFAEKMFYYGRPSPKIELSPSITYLGLGIGKDNIYFAENPSGGRIEYEGYTIHTSMGLLDKLNNDIKLQINPNGRILALVAEREDTTKCLIADNSLRLEALMVPEKPYNEISTDVAFQAIHLISHMYNIPRVISMASEALGEDPALIAANPMVDKAMNLSSSAFSALLLSSFKGGNFLPSDFLPMDYFIGTSERLLLEANGSFEKLEKLVVGELESIFSPGIKKGGLYVPTESDVEDFGNQKD